MNRGVLFQYFEWNCDSSGQHWNELAGRAAELKAAGFTALWLPPAYKGIQGDCETGYAVYDLYDLGEFDQKGSVRTKYGTRDEFLKAVKAIKDAGLLAYVDVVLNHKMGGDQTEEVEVVEVSQDDRNQTASEPYKMHAWSKYTFPGRAGKYSDFQWHAEHFNAFGANADKPDEQGKIYRQTNKNFSGDVDHEFGNFDYLMGADIDTYHPAVNEELRAWGRWYIDTTHADGFRIDAVKHIPSAFFKDWLHHLRTHFGNQELFSVGEYWSGDVQELQQYLEKTEGVMSLFDSPLHFRLQQAARVGRDYDLSKIFDGTLVQQNPALAVTFVDNHDSQPGQSLESWIDDWFKPLAYALVLLRRDGYPCVFYGDYYGNEGANPLKSYRQMIDTMLRLRRDYLYGDQQDYFDHPQCIGWTLSGDAEHAGSMVVLMSTGDAGSKRMKTFHGKRMFKDLTGGWPEPIETDDNGEADFRCKAGSVSVWAQQ